MPNAVFDYECKAKLGQADCIQKGGEEDGEEGSCRMGIGSPGMNSTTRKEKCAKIGGTITENTCMRMKSSMPVMSRNDCEKGNDRGTTVGADFGRIAKRCCKDQKYNPICKGTKGEAAPICDSEACGAPPKVCPLQYEVASACVVFFVAACVCAEQVTV